MMAYIGAEGYLINTELRPGKQHCQNHTPEFLRQTVALCKSLTDAPPLFRMDSGNDANMFWTNLPFSDRALIALYRAHGESERFHSELKSDMNLERLPSGKSETNALALELGMIAYHTFRRDGQIFP